jgi:predicted 2-oxoglutarate/Fe(II)-dependent dioxygenase YbiX
MKSVLESGDRAPPFTLTGRHGGTTRLYSEAIGGPIILIFSIGPADTAVFSRLAGMEGARTFVITDQRADPHPAPACPLLLDPDGSTASAYGVSDGITAFLLDANLRVVAVFPPGSPDLRRDLAGALETIDQAERGLALRQAPVLLIPRVLDPATCQSLMAHLDEDGGEEGNTVRVVDGDIVRAPNFDAKRRRDLSVTDPNIIAMLQEIMVRRVLQELYRAFQVKMTYVEEFKLGCYDAEHGGFFRAHRDNTTPATRHRQFAMTLNLNAEDYEGGELWFPEFGNSLYKPATGEAIVFSCTLMHEVMPVTSGRRYTLLSFFHDDAGEETRTAYMREHGQG